MPFHPNPGQIEKMKLNFYFHTSLWCLKRFYEALKGPHKTFCGTAKKCENIFLLIFSICHGSGREGLKEEKVAKFAICFCQNLKTWKSKYRANLKSQMDLNTCWFFFVLSNNTTLWPYKIFRLRGQIASILEYSETKIFKEKITNRNYFFKKVETGD